MIFYEIYTDVLDRLGEDGADITTKVKRWVNEAYGDVCSRSHFSFLEASTTLDEEADTEEIDISELFYRGIYNIIRTDPTTGAKTELGYLDPENFDDRFKDNETSGDPRYYSIWGTNLRLGPRPDEAGDGNLAVKYITLPALLSADEDVPLIPATYHYLLVLGALAIGYEETEDAGNTARLTQQFEAGIRRLISGKAGNKSMVDQPGFAMRRKDYRI